MEPLCTFIVSSKKPVNVILCGCSVHHFSIENGGCILNDILEMDHVQYGKMCLIRSKRIFVFQRGIREKLSLSQLLYVSSCLQAMRFRDSVV